MSAPQRAPTTSHQPPARPARLVVLVSGSGTNLQALLDACADDAYGADVVAVGSDRDGIEALARAGRASVPTFVHRLAEYATRADWDAAVTGSVASYDPDVVVLAGFMKLLGAAYLPRLGRRTVNSHPALSPSFPGMHGPADALAYGVKITGCTLFVIDDGVDTGPIVAQRAVEVADGDTAESLHERIKAAEREMIVTAVGAMAREGFSVEGRAVRLGRPGRMARGRENSYAGPHTTGEGG